MPSIPNQPLPRTHNFIPIGESIELAGELSNVELAVLPNCDHLPQQECKTAFLAATDAWLAGIA